MKVETAPTYTAAIYMTGDIAQAKQICRAYCFAIGLCVTIERVDFIYTGGEEAGFRVGLINYPRFPARPDEIRAKTRELAQQLLVGLHQHSYSLVMPDETEWFSRRET